MVSIPVTLLLLLWPGWTNIVSNFTAVYLMKLSLGLKVNGIEVTQKKLILNVEIFPKESDPGG